MRARVLTELGRVEDLELQELDRTEPRAGEVPAGLVASQTEPVTAG